MKYLLILVLLTKSHSVLASSALGAAYSNFLEKIFIYAFFLSIATSIFYLVKSKKKPSVLSLLAVFMLIIFSISIVLVLIMFAIALINTLI